MIKAWTNNDLRFDGGVTAVDQNALHTDRIMRVCNGTGDDVYDAVARALECQDIPVLEDAGEFDDPLEILLREEDEFDE